jgi:putative endonuclease
MQEPKQPATYMMANSLRGTIYVGVTSNLLKRDYEHKQGVADGFTKKHSCTLLVWCELHETMESAILREKQIKAGSRQKKINLIEQENPFWHDLSPSIQS